MYSAPLMPTFPVTPQTLHITKPEFKFFTLGIKVAPFKPAVEKPPNQSNWCLKRQHSAGRCRKTTQLMKSKQLFSVVLKEVWIVFFLLFIFCYLNSLKRGYWKRFESKCSFQTPGHFSTWYFGDFWWFLLFCTNPDDTRAYSVLLCSRSRFTTHF